MARFVGNVVVEDEDVDFLEHTIEEYLQIILNTKTDSGIILFRKDIEEQGEQKLRNQAISSFSKAYEQQGLTGVYDKRNSLIEEVKIYLEKRNKEEQLALAKLSSVEQGQKRLQAINKMLDIPAFRARIGNFEDLVNSASVDVVSPTAIFKNRLEDGREEYIFIGVPIDDPEKPSSDNQQYIVRHFTYSKENNQLEISQLDRFTINLSDINNKNTAEWSEGTKNLLSLIDKNVSEGEAIYWNLTYGRELLDLSKGTEYEENLNKYEQIYSEYLEQSKNLEFASSARIFTNLDLLNFAFDSQNFTQEERNNFLVVGEVASVSRRTIVRKGKEPTQEEIDEALQIEKKANQEKKIEIQPQREFQRNLLSSHWDFYNSLYQHSENYFNLEQYQYVEQLYQNIEEQRLFDGRKDNYAYLREIKENTLPLEVLMSPERKDLHSNHPLVIRIMEKLDKEYSDFGNMSFRDFEEYKAKVLESFNGIKSVSEFFEEEILIPLIDKERGSIKDIALYNVSNNVRYRELNNSFRATKYSQDIEYTSQYYRDKRVINSDEIVKIFKELYPNTFDILEKYRIYDNTETSQTNMLLTSTKGLVWLNDIFVNGSDREIKKYLEDLDKDLEKYTSFPVSKEERQKDYDKILEEYNQNAGFYYPVGSKKERNNPHIIIAERSLENILAMKSLVYRDILDRGDFSPYAHLNVLFVLTPLGRNEKIMERMKQNYPQAYLYYDSLPRDVLNWNIQSNSEKEQKEREVKQQSLISNNEVFKWLEREIHRNELLIDDDNRIYSLNSRSDFEALLERRKPYQKSLDKVLSLLRNAENEKGEKLLDLNLNQEWISKIETRYMKAYTQYGEMGVYKVEKQLFEWAEKQIEFQKEKQKNSSPISTQTQSEEPTSNVEKINNTENEIKTQANTKQDTIQKEPAVKELSPSTDTVKAEEETEVKVEVGTETKAKEEIEAVEATSTTADNTTADNTDAVDLSALDKIAIEKITDFINNAQYGDRAYDISVWKGKQGTSQFIQENIALVGKYYVKYINSFPNENKQKIFDFAVETVLADLQKIIDDKKEKAEGIVKERFDSYVNNSFIEKINKNGIKNNVEDNNLNDTLNLSNQYRDEIDKLRNSLYRNLITTSDLDKVNYKFYDELFIPEINKIIDKEIEFLKNYKVEKLLNSLIIQKNSDNNNNNESKELENNQRDEIKKIKEIIDNYIEFVSDAKTEKGTYLYNLDSVSARERLREQMQEKYLAMYEENGFLKTEEAINKVFVIVEERLKKESQKEKVIEKESNSSNQITSQSIDERTATKTEKPQISQSNNEKPLSGAELTKHFWNVFKDIPVDLRPLKPSYNAPAEERVNFDMEVRAFHERKIAELETEILKGKRFYLAVLEDEESYVDKNFTEKGIVHKKSESQVNRYGKSYVKTLYWVDSPAVLEQYSELKDYAYRKSADYLQDYIAQTGSEEEWKTEPLTKALDDVGSINVSGNADTIMSNLYDGAGGTKSDKRLDKNLVYSVKELPSGLMRVSLYNFKGGLRVTWYNYTYNLNGNYKKNPVPYAVRTANYINQKIQEDAHQKAIEQYQRERATQAKELYAQLQDATGQEPYFVRKQMQYLQGLKRLPSGQSASLIVPLYQIFESTYEKTQGQKTLALKGLELIFPERKIQADGSKGNDKLMMTNAEKSNSFFLIGSNEALQNPTHIIFTEGVATADSAHQIFTSLPASITGEKPRVLTIATIDCDNLAKVSESLAPLYPNALKIIGADNDKETELKSTKEGSVIGNVGVKKASKIQNSHPDFMVVIPPDIDNKNTDWNDLICTEGYGLERAKEVFISQYEEQLKAREERLAKQENQRNSSNVSYSLSSKDKSRAGSLGLTAEEADREKKLKRIASIQKALKELDLSANSAFVKAISEVEKEPVSIKTINEKGERVKNIYTPVKMGFTPLALQLCDIEVGEVRITYGTIEKTIAENIGRENNGKYDHTHNIEPNTLKVIPAELCDPVAVIQSQSRANRYVVLVNSFEFDKETNQEKPIITAFHITSDKNSKSEVALTIPSIHGRTDEFIVNNLSSNLLLYLNREKCRDLMLNHFTQQVNRHLIERGKVKNLQILAEITGLKYGKGRFLNTRITTMEAQILHQESDIANNTATEEKNQLNNDVNVVNPNGRFLNTRITTVEAQILHQESDKPDNNSTKDEKQVENPKNLNNFKTEVDLKEFRERLLAELAELQESLNQELNEDKKYSLNTNADKNLSKNEQILQNTKEKIREVLQTSLGVEYASNLEILTLEEARKLEPSLYQLGEKALIEGFFVKDSGQMVIVADSFVGCEELATFTAWHEMGHKTIDLQRTADLAEGKEIWDNWLQEAGKNETVRNISEVVKNNYAEQGKELSALTATEEALVEIFAAYKTQDWDTLENKYGLTLSENFKKEEGEAEKLYLDTKDKIGEIFDKHPSKVSDEMVFAMLGSLEQAIKQNPTLSKALEERIEKIKTLNRELNRELDVSDANKIVSDKTISDNTNSDKTISDTISDIVPFSQQRYRGEKGGVYVDDNDFWKFHKEWTATKNENGETITPLKEQIEFIKNNPPFNVRVQMKEQEVLSTKLPNERIFLAITADNSQENNVSELKEIGIENLLREYPEIYIHSELSNLISNNVNVASKNEEMKLYFVENEEVMQKYPQLEKYRVDKESKDFINMSFEEKLAYGMNNIVVEKLLERENIRSQIQTEIDSLINPILEERIRKTQEIYEGLADYSLQQLERQARKQAQVEPQAEPQQGFSQQVEPQQDFSQQIEPQNYYEQKGMIYTRGFKGLESGHLVIPLLNKNDEIVSLQIIEPQKREFIDETGKKQAVSDKRFLQGTQTKNLFFPFFDDEATYKNPNQVIITEGIATADSVYQICRQDVNSRDINSGDANSQNSKERVLVVSALDSSNLGNVAQIMKEKYPQAQIIIASDNDLKNEIKGNLQDEAYNNTHTRKRNHTEPFYNNIGVQSAYLVSYQNNFNIDVVIPSALSLKEGEEVKNIDWNDILLGTGLEEARKIFNENLRKFRELREQGIQQGNVVSHIQKHLGEIAQAEKTTSTLSLNIAEKGDREKKIRARKSQGKYQGDSQSEKNSEREGEIKLQQDREIDKKLEDTTNLRQENNVMFSLSVDTRKAYEKRIDELFEEGTKAEIKNPVKALDSSDVLGVISKGQLDDIPLYLAEGKVIAGQTKHPLMTSEQWKKVPDWIENPVAVFYSDTELESGKLVFIAPELIEDRHIRIIIEPLGKKELQAHLVLNAYDASEKTPYVRWAEDRLMLYVNREEIGRISQELRRQLSDILKNPTLMPNSLIHSKGSGQIKATAQRQRILTEKNLLGYRKNRNLTRQMVNQETTTQTINNQDKKYSLKTSADKNLSKDEQVLQDTKERIREVLQNSLGAETASTLEILTLAEARKLEPSLYNLGEKALVEGFFVRDTGQMVIVADSFVGCEDLATFTAWHEIAHKTIDLQRTANLEGKEIWDNWLQEAGKNETVKNISDIVRNSYAEQGKELSALTATEEALVEIFASYKTQDWDTLENKYGLTLSENFKKKEGEAEQLYLQTKNKIGEIFDKHPSKVSDEMVFAMLGSLEQAIKQNPTLSKALEERIERNRRNESESSIFKSEVGYSLSGDNKTADFTELLEKATPQRVATTLKQAKELVINNFVRTTLYNEQTGLPATVSNNSLRKMTSESAVKKSLSPQSHALAIANLDKLYPNAILLETHPDKRQEPTIANIHRYFATMLDRKGFMVGVQLMVKETKGKNEPNPLYTIEAIEIMPERKLLQNSRLERVISEESRQTPHSGTVKSLIENISNFNQQVLNEVSYSLRTDPAPKNTGIGYKVFVLKEDKKSGEIGLYPPIVANADKGKTPLGFWLDADILPVSSISKTGRPKVSAGGKGTQNSGAKELAYRSGWHLGEIPYAIQFNRKNPETRERELFPNNFVWAEVEYANDVNYQEEADRAGINANGKYQHSLAGLKRFPKNGSYKYRTNPDPRTDAWIITGAMKVSRVLTREQVAQLVVEAGREPQKIQAGDIVSNEIVQRLNEEIKQNTEQNIVKTEKDVLQSQLEKSIKEDAEKKGWVAPPSEEERNQEVQRLTEEGFVEELSLPKSNVVAVWSNKAYAKTLDPQGEYSEDDRRIDFSLDISLRNIQKEQQIQKLEQLEKDLRIAKVLQGGNVCELSDFQAPKPSSDKTKPALKPVKIWANAIFDSWGKSATNPELGEIVLDKVSVDRSLAHGRSPYKIEAFRAIKDTIEQGVVISEKKINEQTHFHISAPIKIGEFDDVITLLVKKDVNMQRMYLHSVILKSDLVYFIDRQQEAQKNTPTLLVRSADTEISELNRKINVGESPEHLDWNADTEVSKPNHKLYSGDVAKILRKYLNVNILDLEKQVAELKKSIEDNNKFSLLSSADKNQLVNNQLVNKEQQTQKLEQLEKDLQIAKVLQGEAVSVLNDNQAPNPIIGETALSKWTYGIFKGWGKKINNPVLGEVYCGGNSARNTIYHGQITPERLEAVLGIKDVIEKGVITAQATVGDKEHIYLTAPVVINNEERIMSVLLHREINAKSQNLYLHNVVLKEKFTPQKVQEFIAEHAQEKNNPLVALYRSVSAVEKPAYNPKRKLQQGDLGKLFYYYLNVNTSDLEKQVAELKKSIKVNNKFSLLFSAENAELDKNALDKTDKTELDKLNKSLISEILNDSKEKIRYNLSKVLGEEVSKRIELMTLEEARALNPSLYDLKEDAIVQGFFVRDNAQTVLIVDAFVGREDLVGFTAYHELGHRGIALQGREIWDKYLDYARSNATVREIADKTQARYANEGKKLTELTATEEALVDIFASYKRQDWKTLEEKHGIKLSENFKKKEGEAEDLYNRAKDALDRIINGDKVLIGNKINGIETSAGGKNNSFSQANNSNGKNNKVAVSDEMLFAMLGFLEKSITQDERLLKEYLKKVRQEEPVVKEVADKEVVDKKVAELKENSEKLAKPLNKDNNNEAKYEKQNSEKQTDNGLDKFSFELLNKNKHYRQVIDELAQGKRKANGLVIRLGTTPDVLRLLGINKAKVGIKDNVLVKAMGRHLGVRPTKNKNTHSVKGKDLKSIISLISNPVAVLQSAPTSSNPNGILILTDLVEKDKDTGKENLVVVALNPVKNTNNKEGRIYALNITSIYGRDNKHTARDIKNGLLLYWNNEKGRVLQIAASLQLPTDFNPALTPQGSKVKTEEDLSQYRLNHNTNSVISRKNGETKSNMSNASTAKADIGGEEKGEINNKDNRERDNKGRNNGSSLETSAGNGKNTDKKSGVKTVKGAETTERAEATKGVEVREKGEEKEKSRGFWQSARRSVKNLFGRNLSSNENIPDSGNNSTTSRNNPSSDSSTKPVPSPANSVYVETKPADTHHTQHNLNPTLGDKAIENNPLGERQEINSTSNANSVDKGSNKAEIKRIEDIKKELLRDFTQSFGFDDKEKLEKVRLLVDKKISNAYKQGGIQAVDDLREEMLKKSFMFKTAVIKANDLAQTQQATAQAQVSEKTVKQADRTKLEQEK